MYEYDGQVVKVIIYSRRNGHFPVMVLHTLNKVCMENITVFFSFSTMVFNKVSDPFISSISNVFGIWKKNILYTYGQDKSIFVFNIVSWSFNYASNIVNTILVN